LQKSLITVEDILCSNLIYENIDNCVNIKWTYLTLHKVDMFQILHTIGGHNMNI
jgi:hypothetical protein